MARTASSLVIPKNADALRRFLVERRVAGDLPTIDRVLEAVLAEKPSPRTQAVLFEALLAIAERRPVGAIAARAWPTLLARAFGPTAHWASGGMYALSRALEAAPRHRKGVLSLAARAMRQPKFGWQSSSASVVALAFWCAVAARDGAGRALALKSWRAAIEGERPGVRNDDLLVWSLQTMAKAGAEGEVAWALGRLDAPFRKLAAKNATLAEVKAASGSANLRSSSIEALRAQRGKHRHRKLSAAAIAKVRLGDGPLPPSLAEVLTEVGELPDFTGSFGPREQRRTAALLKEMGVARRDLPALAAALPGESVLLSDTSLLYAGLGRDAEGELPVLTFVEEDERLVLAAPSYGLWLAIRTGVLSVPFVGGLAADPAHRAAMRSVAKRFGKQMKLSTGQYVVRT